MEEQSIERLKNGNQAALETVFNLYAAKLYRVAQRILGDATDSEEVVQDVFWTVYRKANSFKGEAKFSAWLYRLTVNAALGRIRKRKQQSAIEYQAYFRTITTSFILAVILTCWIRRLEMWRLT
jgi:RNA polymerase sigma-70 factor, ECF subfamily